MPIKLISFSAYIAIVGLSSSAFASPQADSTTFSQQFELFDIGFDVTSPNTEPNNTVRIVQRV